MAIQFLTGLNIQGNIDLNVNQLQNVVIQPLGADPAGTAGRIYYNSGTNKLKLYDGTQWVDFSTGTDDDTTYTFNVPAATTTLRLAGTDSSQQDVSITGSGLISVTRTSATELTIGTTATNNVGTVTSVDVSGGTTGLTASGGPVTSSGTITLAGTLNEVSGGTGQSTYTTGDILYASASNTLAKLAIGSTGQVLKVAGGIPSWAADTNTGLTSVGITETGNALTITNTPLTANGDINIAGAGTSSQVILGDLTLATLPVDGVTSITVAGDNGNGSSITSSGTISIDGTGLISTSVSGTTVTISTSATSNTGTVTSVATGSGLTGGTITGSGTISVDYGTSGLVADAPTASPQIGESDDYILIGDDSASGATKKIQLVDIPLNQFGSPSSAISMASNKLTDLSNGTASADAVNLGQVQSLVAGVGVFQGGYDATNDPGTPNISGASNVALTTGDFYVVTADGDITFSDTTVSVEVGDLIFANSNISANSNPASTDYTIVIQDQNIAGVGATDGATEKGVAGFSSASFAGTASGFITIKAGGISDAQLASTFNKIIGTDTGLDTDGVDVVDQINVTDGVITSMSKRTLPNATTTAVGVTEIATQAEVDAGTDNFRYVTPLTLKTAVGKQAFSGTYPATSTNSWTIDAATHGLGATQGPFVIQTYISGAQVYIDVAIASNGTITFTTTNNQAINAVVCNIMKVN